MSTLSNIRTTMDGDLYVGRGQLGLGWRGSATTGTALWSLQRGANHYVITPTNSPTIVTLPVVGTLSTQAQPGHWLTIVNIGSNSLVVNNATGTTIGTLTAGKSIMLIADSVVASNWVVQYDTTGYGSATTLQGAYDASGSTDPQIRLNIAGGAVKIGDYVGDTGEIFVVTDSSTYRYLNVGNSGVSGNHFAGILGGDHSSSVNNTLAVGTVTTGGSGVVALSDSASAYTGYNTNNTLYTLFSNGEFHYGGSVKEGTTKTSPNERIIYFSVNAVGTAGATTDILVGAANFLLPSSSYSITMQIYGRDATSSSSVSVRHTIEVLVTVDSVAAVTIIGQTIQTMETSGFTSIAANATVGTASGRLNITLNAPDNVAGPTSQMDFRGVIRYRVLTE